MEDNLRQRYTKEYKLHIVRLIKDEQRNVSELSKELGIAAGILYRWVKAYEKNPEEYLPGEGKPSEKEELRRLKKKLSNA